MPAGHTQYDVLGITAQAPQEIISAVYRAWMQALRIHPDLGGDEELAKRVNAAYEVLKDPEKRAAYDESIAAGAPQRPAEVRRRSRRVAIDVPIAFCIPPDGRWIPAQAVDASTFGIRLMTGENLIVGMHVSIAFTGSVAAAAEAYVRWIRALGANGAWRNEVGVEFFSPVPDILKRLGA